MNALTTWFKRMMPGTAAKEGDGPQPITENALITYDRPQFSGLGLAGSPRYNPDELVRKKGLSVYAKMRIDEQVKAVCTFKRDAIMSRGWTFQFDKGTTLSEEEQKRRLRIFDQIIARLSGSFVDTLNAIATGREYGFSITEKLFAPVVIDGQQWQGLDKLVTRDPETFEFVVDDKGELNKITQAVGQKSINVPQERVIHYVHNPEFDAFYGRSDLREAYRSWFIKDQLIKYWAMYLERVGGGFLTASVTEDTAPRPGTAAYTQLQNSMAGARNGGAIIAPKGVTVSIVYPSSNDGYEAACTWHDLAIARSLLVPNLLGVSHTGTTGAFAQSQTQIEAFAWTIRADAERMAATLNDQLFWDLGERNFGDGEYPIFKFQPLSQEQLRWMITTWTGLVGGKIVLPTEVDEARLREILDMPPRDETTQLVVDPMAQQQLDVQREAAQAQAAIAASGQRPGKEDEDEEREEMRRRALFHTPGGHDHDQSTHGEGGGGGDSINPKAAKKAANLISKAKRDGMATILVKPRTDEAEAEAREQVPEMLRGIAQRMSEHNYAAASRDIFGGKETTYTKGSHTWVVRSVKRPQAFNPNDSSKGNSYIEFDVTLTYKKALKMAEARKVAFRRAIERINFAVIERRQSFLSDNLARDLSQIVARSVGRIMGTDEQLARLTDSDVEDIAGAELSGVEKGKLKQLSSRALNSSWIVGRQMADEELRKAGKPKAPTKFADIRDNATSFFEANGFRMAGNVSDGTRALIQQELQNSVKYGRSPRETRTAIWDRLVAKGFSSRAAVRTVEEDEAVMAALDELWLDTEEQAASYLDTLARTNLFEAMNEARYAEYTDPALDGFVVALRYSAILDDRTTKVCAELHDSVYRVGSDYWDDIRPPNHYNCRSVLVPITELDIEDGEWDGQESDPPRVEPQEGFGRGEKQA